MNGGSSANTTVVPQIAVMTVDKHISCVTMVFPVQSRILLFYATLRSVHAGRVPFFFSRWQAYMLGPVWFGHVKV
jgi:hypothetical protein